MSVLPGSVKNQKFCRKLFFYLLTRYLRYLLDTVEGSIKKVFGFFFVLLTDDLANHAGLVPLSSESRP
jgi:hypothetical protein